jgi:hypothetical protein
MHIDPEQNRKRFLLESGQLIRDANRKIIHERIPKLTKDSILSFAITVAQSRARYLEAAFGLSAVDQNEPVNEHNFNELRLYRELYEETRSAYEAIQNAIEHGYVDIDE